MRFTIGNCRFVISYYFFAMTAALVLMCHDSLFLCGISAAAVHELGHIIAMLFTAGSAVREVCIGALGVKISADGADERPVIILAGVISNAAVSILCMILLYYDRTNSIALQLMTANACLALCNILPIEPLDGGVLLRCMLERFLPLHTADRAVFIISLVAMTPLAAAGIFAVMQSRGNFSLLILCLWLLAGILKRYL